MDDLFGADSAPSADRASRRFAAVLLSLLAPGLGHLAIGYPRRMVAWYSSLIAVLAVTLGGATRGTPFTMVVCFGIAATLRVGAAIDTLRLVRPPTLPRPRVVVLIVIGFYAFWCIIAGQVRSKLIEAFQIPSGSMYPTLVVGDHVFATKLDHTYVRGEVIAFRYPPDPEISYMKRIVAVGGDRVELRNDTLIVNGEAVPRTETEQPCQVEGGDTCMIWEETLDGHRYGVAEDHARMARDFSPYLVPPGSVFVLGDNRDNSSDSRVWGSVPLELVLGKITGVWWSYGPAGVRWDRVNLRIR